MSSNLRDLIKFKANDYMTLLTKIKWVASILLVFFIVLTTNLIDKDNFERLRNSVTTIYEDRIVASDLLFELLMLVQEKEFAFISSDSLFFENRSEANNREMGKLIQRYEQTKLTERERMLLFNLKRDLNHLQELEKQYISSESADKDAWLTSLDEIVQTLSDLSKVQLKEGRQHMLMSNKTMDTIDLFTQIEIVFLILMAILIQVIILYKPKE
jgi:hypothetical protein